MEEGALIDYRIRLFGVPMQWRTEIVELCPPSHFVDLQLRGPYARWHHSHHFESVPGGTLMTDRVEYRVPLGPLGALAHGIFVRRNLERIFGFRRTAAEEVFGPRAAGTEPVDVAQPGGRGGG